MCGPMLATAETAVFLRDVGQAFNGLDTLWILVAAFLVFFMQAGFGMLETGFVRTKNAANVLTKNVMDFCFAALGYFIFGYAIMYGGVRAGRCLVARASVRAIQ